MIDFRYHIVSIVSIFLALAVGIVLGAGPLQDNLGTTLTDQVNQLRSDKEALRGQAAQAEASASAAEVYAERVNPAALAGALDNSLVLLIGVPGAGDGLAESTTSALEAAGATVVSLRATDAWVAPDRKQERIDAAVAMAKTLSSTSAQPLTEAALPALLTSLVVTASPSASTLTANESQALTELKTSGFIDFATLPTARATGVVIIGGVLTGDADAVSAQGDTLSELVADLDRASKGAVVAQGSLPAADPARPGPSSDLVTLMRKDGTVAALASTVDHADTAVGSGTVVLALVQQNAGGLGHYGTAAGAKAVVPPAA